MVTKPSAAAVVLLCGVLAIAAGCNSAIHAKAPAVPAAPVPVSAPPQPLILAQTTVDLPTPQPVPPESVPPRPPLDAPIVEAAEPVIQAPRRANPPVRARPQEPARLVAPLPPIPAPEETAGPLLSGEDLAKSDGRIPARLVDLRSRLRPFANSPNAGTKSAASRIESFLRLADQALKRGDLRQADAMADRAQTLLQELARQ
jgi:hypothetical protein